MEFDLFTWWMASISFSIVFLTIVSIYLYANRTCERTDEKTNAKAKGVLTNFVFVWVLIGLLIFYIVAVKLASAVVFAIGNIVVEVILIAYLYRNKTKISEETTIQQ
jgi:choline-glycine betaine transporter